MTFARGSLASRALALGLAAILAAAAIILPGRPLLERWRASGELIQNHRSQTRAAEALSEAERRVGAAETQWRDFSVDPRSGLAPEATAALAGEAALSRIRALVLASEGRWDEGSVVGASRQGLRIEKVRFMAKGALLETRLTPFLSSLETEPPFIFIDRFGAVIEKRPPDGPPLLAITIEGEVERLANDDKSGAEAP